MSDPEVSTVRRALLAAFGVLRGLIVGVASVAIAFGIAYISVPRSASEDPPCGEADLACLPDLGPLILAMVIIAVAVPVVSPLVAWAVRLPRWWYFVLPGLWVSGLLFSSTSASTPLLLFLVIVPYALVALWTVNAPQRARQVGEEVTPRQT